VNKAWATLAGCSHRELLKVISVAIALLASWSKVASLFRLSYVIDSKTVACVMTIRGLSVSVSILLLSNSKLKQIHGWLDMIGSEAAW